ncbi:MAG: S-layer homology domain-containing protein [Peptoniphilus harei]|uniref:S-layer homology domain-containing protein n=1 Tax=Peptoniphilus harei TaxID=54005 RepID=UPI0028FFA6FB|nr:S-layer homology domain-containing protein [Peptoniphilus harei]MDU1176498.1 S-layer homology domain-containing protein [Peptoniphilus harei]MDU2373152.1 S-layer homology domain-containing protein [Peptoniphilus harei]
MKSNNLKRAAALGLAALMLAPSATFAKEFKDVKKKNNKYSWAYDAIDILSDKNVISGHPDGEFKPGESVSLEELLQLIKQVLRPSDEEIKNATTKYSKMAKDNGVNKWAEEAVCLALDRGYLDENSLKKANERGFFKISQREYPSRGDIAIFFARALQLSPNGNTNLLKHNDKDKLSDTLKGYLSSLVEAKIFTATGSDGNFEGDRPITRAETAIITKASFDYAEKNKIEAKTEKMKGTVVLSSKLNSVNVVIIENKGTKYSFDIDNNTKYKLKDKDIKLEDIKAGQEVEIEYTKAKTGEREGTAKTITVTNAMLDMVGYVNSKGNNQITLRYRDNSDSLNFRTTSKISTSDTKTFDLDKNVKIKAYGKDLKLEDIAVDDLVEFKTNADNKITEITVFPKEAYVKGQIVSMENTNKDKASIKLKLSDGKTYEFYITNETNRLNDVSLNDNVTFYVKYKVLIGKSDDQNNGLAMGRVRNVSLYETTFDYYRKSSDPYIELELNSGGYKTYSLVKDPIIREGGIRVNSVTEDFLRGKTVNLKLNDNGKVEEINIVNKDLQFNTMFQVLSAQKTSYEFKTYDVSLKVIQSDNNRIKPGRIINLTLEGNVKLKDVFLANGYLDENSNISQLNVEEVVGNTGYYELDQVNGIRERRKFYTFKQLERDSSRNSFTSGGNGNIYTY